MVTAKTICVKSPKGQDEIERRTYRLTPRLRQLLIMMDGRRDMAALQTVFPPDLVPGLMQQLLDQGFIIELATAPATVAAPSMPPSRLASQTAPAPLGGGATGEEDPFLLGQTFMVNLASRILGIAGNGIVAKLRLAHDVEGLRALYWEWRNTIKQAPDGLLRLKELEKKLSKVLGELPTSGA
jgi:hypothetical protein